MFETCCSNIGLSVAPSSEDKQMISSFLKSKSFEAPPPSVFDDAIAMLAGSLIIYFFADLRDMARAGELSSTTIDDLSPPLTADEVMSRIQGNEEALSKRAIDSEDLQQRLEALKSLKQHDAGLFSNLFQSSKAQTTLTHFVDTKGE